MAFTYTKGSTADRDRVRLTIGDTDESRPLLEDEELDDFLVQEGDSVINASAAACESLALKFARDYTFSVDGASFQKGQITVHYQKLARRLRNRGRGTTTIMPRRKDGYSVFTNSDEVSGINIFDSGLST